MAIKKMIECRCMTWEENAMHDDLVEELLDKDPKYQEEKFCKKWRHGYWRQFIKSKSATLHRARLLRSIHAPKS